GELKRKVAGVSAKVLTERLRMLAEAGVVHRRFEATIPPQVTYSLTSRGEELRGVLDQLNTVAIRWQVADKAAQLEADRPGSDRAGIDHGAVAVAAAASPVGAGE
ncbi:MAG: winged helix-turn-helix transcriptional regulator, partial [Dongiaceae bacterium]